jgi:hypothetical protein
MLIREAALGNLITYYDIPYIFSDFARVKLSKRALDTFARVRKPPEEVVKKLIPYVDKEMRRGDITSELSLVLSKAESDQYLNTIVEFSSSRGPFINVGMKGEDYPRFIKDWKDRAGEIKEWIQWRSSPKGEGKK